MKKSKILALILGLCITLPAWFFLLYTILTTIEVDRLVWFIFWVYMPVTILVKILINVGEQDE